MGGFYGAGRWRGQATRRSTDDALALDVGWLARRGCLRPGLHEVTWTLGERRVAAVVVVVDAGDQEAVVLVYQVVRFGEAPAPVRLRVRIARTACTYGGTRPWFLCPGCGARRAVLYAANGAFRCRGRACHDLAYGSTREPAFKRMARRAEAVQRRLGGDGRGSVYEPPPRPKGMHATTYARLCRELGEFQLAALGAVAGRGSGLGRRAAWLGQDGDR